MLKIIISILFILLLLSISFNIQISSSEIGLNNTSIEKIIKNIGIKLSSVYPGLPYELINKFLIDVIHNRPSNPNEIQDQINNIYSIINKYPCGIIAQSLSFNIITINNLKYEYDCKDLKSEIYQNHIQDTTTPSIGPTGTSTPSIGPTGTSTPSIGPTGTSTHGKHDITISKVGNEISNNTTSKGDNRISNNTTSKGDNGIGDTISLFSNINEYSELLDNLPTATMAEGLPNSKVRGQAGLLSLLPETTELGQEAQSKAASLPLSSPSFEGEITGLQPLLDDQTPNKRLTTFPKYLQEEKATEAVQEKAGDLDTETTFFRDILETDGSEDGASASEEESEVEDEESEDGASASEEESEVEDEESEDGASASEEESVKSINLENDDEDSKDNDDEDSKDNDDEDSKDNDDEDSKDNDDKDQD